MRKKTYNKKNWPYVSTFKYLERELDRSWKKLNRDIKNEAKGRIIRKDTENIAQLLGECNYIMKEMQRVKNTHQAR